MLNLNNNNHILNTMKNYFEILWLIVEMVSTKNLRSGYTELLKFIFDTLLLDLI